MASWRNEMEGLEEAGEAYLEPECIRHGGQQADDEDEEARLKREDRERKKAEVRARLEAANKKVKKGFLTPERKRKLRKLLMEKAAEDLKKEQQAKAAERQRILNDRIMTLPDVDSMGQGELESFVRDLFDAIRSCEDSKYDIDRDLRAKDFEINELSIAVNDLRGKFVKPTLKKVSKNDSKFAKMEELRKKKEAEAEALRNVSLKSSGVNKYELKDEEKEEKPEWGQKVDENGEEDE